MTFRRFFASLAAISIVFMIFIFSYAPKTAEPSNWEFKDWWVNASMPWATGIVTCFLIYAVLKMISDDR